MILPKFEELLYSIRPDGWKPPERLLAIDPGETTGWAYFADAELVATGEVGPEDVSMQSIDIMDVLDVCRPYIVIVEDYRIYGHKAKSHSWSALHTPKLIGAIEALCTIRKIPMVLQGASSKQFCTNCKLQQWGFYQVGSAHRNDAVRHACYWLLFNKEA